jgi:hypothetical protein
MKRLLLLAVLVLGLTVGAGTASAHVHGITPLLTLANGCEVTTLSNTGANRAVSHVITGLIPSSVGNAPLESGDGGRTAPVGCVENGP